MLRGLSRGISAKIKYTSSMRLRTVASIKHRMVCMRHLHISHLVLGAPTVAMAIIARLGVNIAVNIGFQYAAEMLPTVVRAQGVSLIHNIGYLAHIVGPYIIYLVSKANRNFIFARFPIQNHRIINAFRNSN